MAKHNHVARAFNYRGIEIDKRCLFQSDENGLLNLLMWIESIKQEHGLTDVLLGVETTGHYWLPLFHFLKQRARYRSRAGEPASCQEKQGT
nr:transposase [Paenibacillus sp. A3]